MSCQLDWLCLIIIKYNLTIYNYCKDIIKLEYLPLDWWFFESLSTMN
jgi:hypothetical protein